MTKEILHKEIPIPRVNEFPFEKGQKWAKGSYARTQSQVDEKRAKEFKERLPLGTVEYVKKMTFGIWCLTGPAEGQDTSVQSKSPLDTALDCLKPYIDEARLGQFKKQFRKELKQSFSSIGWSDYNPVRVKEKNIKIKQLVNEFALKGYDLHLEFVLHPDTAEPYNSLRFLAIRNKIHLHFTGKPLDMSKYQGPGSSRRMDMHLDIQVASA